MTPEEWQRSSDPAAMLSFVTAAGMLTQRKVCLFAVACCRRIWSLVTDERSRNAVEVLERFADGFATAEELQAASCEAKTAATHWADAYSWGTRAQAGIVRAADAVQAATAFEVVRAAQLAAVAVGHATVGPKHDEKLNALFASWTGAQGTPEHTMALHAWVLESERACAADQACTRAEVEEQCHLLRDLIGLGIPMPAQRTPEVVALAATIYEEQAFDLMTALGAALSDAGCTEPSVLEHCSLPNHVKGCWLVDAVLAKR